MIRGWKFFKFISITGLIALAVFVGKKLVDSLNINTYATRTEISITVPQDKYYYSKLDYGKEDLYDAIYNGVSRYEKEIVLIQDLREQEALTLEDIGEVLDFYMKDNPQVFYISLEYGVEQSEVMHYQIVKIQLTYEYTEAEIEQYNTLLENEINKIVTERVTKDMTEFEKELALHDYLLENAEYYYSDNVESIPYEKHTAYSALINKSCVCDGFSKAFSLLLDKVNIENIVVSGKIGNVNHSWNLVNLDDEWYNVDVTSDNQKTNEGLRVKTHIFFNVTDKAMENEYTKDNLDILPKCTADKYNYYIHNSYVIESTSNIKSQLRNDMTAQRNMQALEIMVNSSTDITQTLVNTLYSLNFNNYKINGIKTINYFKHGNIYIFPKSK